MRRTLGFGEVAGGREDLALIGLREGDGVPAPGAPPAVPHEVGGDPEEIGAAVRLALPVAARAQESIEAFLQQVVGDLRVAGHPREVAPERSGRSVVERTERIFVHLERHVDLCSFEPFDVGERQVTHGHLALLPRAFDVLARRCGRFEEAQTARQEE